MGGMFLRRKYQKKSTIVVGIALALIVSTITAFFHVPLLKHTSKEFISEQGGWQASRLVMGSTAERNCRYVTSGPWLVVDDNGSKSTQLYAYNEPNLFNMFFSHPLLLCFVGYTCSRKNQDPDTGCCPPEPPRYICTGCQRASHCCEHFEFCVSCCLSKVAETECTAIRLAIDGPVFFQFALCSR
mmetsp:Transcript_24355/g.95942  ORF Transcript_24355/g.95942 Transcript_24355/m.95942 type:complete len:185 (+) Transcript_24355:432-986(+)